MGFSLVFIIILIIIIISTSESLVNLMWVFWGRWWTLKHLNNVISNLNYPFPIIFHHLWTMQPHWCTVLLGAPRGFSITPEGAPPHTSSLSHDEFNAA